MRDHLLLYINGRAVRVSGDDAFLSLSDYLRLRERLIGTKVVCAEGDCGSCSALVGRVVEGAMRYAAVTSCIQMMLQLDATHIVTIEGLGRQGELNPIQQALVKCQGTQCGFCTPGFVVAMYDALRHPETACDAHTATRGLVGNLCRCTGYDSILRAGMTTDRGTLASLDELYPPATMAAQLSAAADDDVRIDAPPRWFYKPVTVEQAVRFRHDHPGTTLVAGATDLGVLQNKRIRTIDTAMSLAGLAELRGVHVEGGAVVVGAAATLTEFEQAALAHIPELGRFMAWFGSPLIKNAGTLAGNLVTGSPIGDTIPALTVLGATIGLASAGGGRSVPIDEFYTGYRQTVLAPDEIVTTIRVPIPTPDTTFKLYKVSRRKDLDIAGFGAAIWLRRRGAVIDDLRIAYGGVGPRVMRMTRTEETLRGKHVALGLFERAAAIARQEVTPISDVRGSDAYRRALAGNILIRFWHETMAGEGGDNGHGGGAAPPAPAGAKQPALVHHPERQG